MQIQVLKSKIHRVKVTGADLNYIGSITIDESLLSFNIIEGEKVAIVNINNGERFETYAIKGKNSGTITLNGPAARKVQRTSLLLFLMRQWNLKPLKHSNHGLFSQMKTTTH
jgi:aspartate 1-decarboxylase